VNAPGLPAPPPLGATALPAGTYGGDTVFVTGGGTGLGKAIAAEARFGLPRVLVNNAAANFPSPAEDLSPNAWRTVVDITLNGTFLVTREFGRRHLAAGTPASIVCVGASYAWTGGPGFAHSAAAKAGVKNLVETLAVEWGPHGIQVNGLVPGLFPHEDMTGDIREGLEQAGEGDGAAHRRATGTGLGRHVPRLALRPLRFRPHARRRRRQLAAPQPRQPVRRDRP
jgi:NAD(P)-dependent dehydrogenase (short-subunit alcohol dehydrogenase family)